MIQLVQIQSVLEQVQVQAVSNSNNGVVQMQASSNSPLQRGPRLIYFSQLTNCRKSRQANMAAERKLLRSHDQYQ
jgi:hypothetical protein